MAQTRIIIVDDDSLIRMDLRDLLQRMGYLVVGEAGDAQSSINTARSLRPDLVIMDVRMAGDKDGIDAAATLTAERLAPVLLLTAFSDMDLVQRATEAGVGGYLLKPFSEGELRNLWKPTAQEGLWFHGGNLALSRYYSLYLALQLKARMEGIPTPVYKRAEVHHTE